MKVHVDIREQVARVLHAMLHARAFAHAVMRPAQKRAHLLVPAPHPAGRMHRAIVGEEACHQRLVIAGEEAGEVGLVIEHQAVSLAKAASCGA